MLVLTASYAQTDTTESVLAFMPPNYGHIKSVMNDKHSPQYLPTIAAMVENTDTNITLDDLQVLYYGQSLKEGYNPYKDVKQIGKIRDILKQTDISKNDAEMILSLCNDIIKSDPAEPRAYWYRFIAYNILAQYYNGDTTLISKADTQLRMILAAIQSTGDGTTPETAMHITQTAHEYFLLSLFDFEFAGQSLLHDDQGHAYDKMEVKENPYGIEALYFNIDAITNYWGRLTLERNLTEKSDEPVNEITLDLGTKFVLEMMKTRKKKSTFKIVSVETISDTILNDDPTLFPDTIPENQIIGYFCMTKVFSSGATPCLITKANLKHSIINMDTEIQYEGQHQFHSTSNNGIIGTARGTEIWNDPLSKIRISNIRSRK